MDFEAARSWRRRHRDVVAVAHDDAVLCSSLDGAMVG
jgi:hypothetical protein